MWRSLTIAVSATSLMAASQQSCAAPVTQVAAQTPAESMTRNAVVEDLTYFRDVWAPKERAFTPQSLARFNAFVSHEIAMARPMSRAELAILFARGEAFTGNAHSATNYFRIDGLFHTLPISFWTFADGPFITRTDPSLRELLGARIERIGGVPFLGAANRVGVFISGTAERKRYLAPAFLTRVEVLEA